jgi:uracil-DNA glycosylase family 4
MKVEQRRAWQALDIGPLWASRVQPVPTPAVAPALQQASALLDTDGPSVGAEPKPPGASPMLAGDAGTLVHPASAAPDLDALDGLVRACQRCGLCRSRTNTVFGVGDRQADWMVIGEAPGAEEDRLGEPFVGRAGQLLDAMLFAVGRSRRKGVFIANVLKCRPPDNRNPQPEEAANCLPYLRRQIELIAPKLILVVGKVAAHGLLETDASLASLRGRVHRYLTGPADIPVVVTYHPAYLLRTPLDKARAWEDLRRAASILQG